MTGYPALVFPDVELWACNTLRAALAASGQVWAPQVAVGITQPSPRPERLVVVTSDPGPARTVSSVVNLRVRCWAPTEFDAVELAGLARAWVIAAADGTGGVSRLPGAALPAWFADPADVPARVLWVPLLVRATPL